MCVVYDRLSCKMKHIAFDFFLQLGFRGGGGGGGGVGGGGGGGGGHYIISLYMYIYVCVTAL